MSQVNSNKKKKQQIHLSSKRKRRLSQLHAEQAQHDIDETQLPARFSPSSQSTADSDELEFTVETVQDDNFNDSQEFDNYDTIEDDNDNAVIFEGNTAYSSDKCEEEQPAVDKSSWGLTLWKQSQEAAEKFGESVKNSESVKETENFGRKRVFLSSIGM